MSLDQQALPDMLTRLHLTAIRDQLDSLLDEAVTSRPLLLAAIAARTRHARQTTIRATSAHAKSLLAAKALTAVAAFLRGLAKNAEQLTSLQIWRAILARAFKAFLGPRVAPTLVCLAPT